MKLMSAKIRTISAFSVNAVTPFISSFEIGPMSWKKYTKLLKVNDYCFCI